MQTLVIEVYIFSKMGNLMIAEGASEVTLNLRLWCCPLYQLTSMCKFQMDLLFLITVFVVIGENRDCLGNYPSHKYSCNSCKWLYYAVVVSHGS
jgi:hypothetical protein